MICAGNKEVALRDAAKAAILLEPQKRQPEGRARLGKALFRKGSAHAAKGPHDATMHLFAIYSQPYLQGSRQSPNALMQDMGRPQRCARCADQLYEALEAFRAAARLMKDPALKMAIGDALQELSAAGVAKVLLLPS